MQSLSYEGGGCKMQSLSYEAQLKAKEQQVRDLVVHVGKFSDQEPEFVGVMKPIVPSDIQFHYRNKMEFSFGPKGWVPAEQLQEKSTDECVYALGLHAPRFFDKVLNVNKCLLQSDSANEVYHTWRKKEVRSLLRKDPQFWTYRPLSELMVCAAAYDVRFLPYVFHKMMEKLSEQSLWRLAVCGSLCCRCFCISYNKYADWPAIPSIPEFLNVERDTLEDEMLSILDVPPGKMGCVIGRTGSSILSVK